MKNKLKVVCFLRAGHIYSLSVQIYVKCQLMLCITLGKDEFDERLKIPEVCIMYISTDSLLHYNFNEFSYVKQNLSILHEMMYESPINTAKFIDADQLALATMEKVCW